MRTRVLTAVGLMPVVLGTFFCASPVPIACLAALVAGICFAEFAGLTGGRFPWLALLLTPFAFIPIILKIGTLMSSVDLLLLSVLGVISAFNCTFERRRSVWNLGLACFWFTAPLFGIVLLHGLLHSARLWQWQNPVLLAVVPLWAGDSAAYFIGKRFGKHLLAPKISPKKTVEGAVANLVGCVVVAVLLSLWMEIPLWIGALCGFSAGTFGQFGDLFESFLKRRYEVKDSGKLLPGHGGMLDRIDSLLFNAPVVLLILSYVKYA